MKKVGMWASLICAIHCTVLPLLLVLLPTAGVYLFINETFEYVLLGISLIFNITNICFGYRQHKSNKAIALLAFGIFMFVVGKLLHHHNQNHAKLEFDLFNVFMIFGGLLMAVSSILNEKFCNNCKTCGHNHEG